MKQSLSITLSLLVLQHPFPMYVRNIHPSLPCTWLQDGNIINGCAAPAPVAKYKEQIPRKAYS